MYVLIYILVLENLIKENINLNVKVGVPNYNEHSENNQLGKLYLVQLAPLPIWFN